MGVEEVMFDFIDMLSFGEKFKAYGEEWIQIKYIYDNLCIAAKARDKAPALLYFVERPEKKKENKP